MSVDLGFGFLELYSRFQSQDSGFYKQNFFLDSLTWGETKAKVISSNAKITSP